MSDPKDFEQDELLDFNEDIELADDGFDLDFDELDDVIEDDLDIAAAPVASAETSSAGRLWLLGTVLSFVSAIVFAYIFSQASGGQEQRKSLADEAVSMINLTSLAAGQSLTRIGRFEPVERSLADTEAAITQLANSSGVGGRLADVVFANSEGNAKVMQEFQTYQTSVSTFLENRDNVQQMKQRLAELNGVMAKAVGDSVGFVEAVSKEGRNKSTGSSKDKYLFLTSEASNLNGILSRLGASTNGYFSSSADLNRLADAQNGLMVRLQETLNRIVSNSAAVVGTAAEPLRNQYSDLETRILDIGEGAVAMTQAREALGQLREQGAVLAESVQQASNQGSASNLSNLAWVLPALLALLGGFCLWRFSQTRSAEVGTQDGSLEETLADQQEAILKLLDEMSALADGDLTVQAEVTDQITGAIADSVNFAVIEMRELVSQINHASIEVANESEQAVSNAQSVSQSNISQSDDISKAAAMMQRVSQDMLQMSQEAANSADMATDSLTAANQGAQAVRDTIDGMDNIREQIQETSKRIKRLGESSQRIGDIVALIDDIAEQTNILSLNAAIQASMAGEAGRGFAVVSDEVQSLAERSTEATKRIAELVTTIQNDTNDAVLSMEQATQQVVSGAKVADTAGRALADIENVSKALSDVVARIAQGSTSQAETVSQVSEQVVDISDSSTETAQKAQDSANSIAKLLELAKDLETSVSRFKLPA